VLIELGLLADPNAPEDGDDTAVAPEAEADGGPAPEGEDEGTVVDAPDVEDAEVADTDEAADEDR